MAKTQINDEKTYRKPRKKGESKEKAARVANAAAADRKGGKSHSYDAWNKEDLVKRAKEVGIKGRSTMKKAELVKALRHH
jgi:general stress protein YciG